MKTFEIDIDNACVKAPYITRPLNVLLLIVLVLFSPIAYLIAIVCCIGHKLPITGMWEAIWKDVEDTYKEAFYTWIGKEVRDQNPYITWVVTLHVPTWQFWVKCFFLYAFIIGVALFFKEYKIDCEDAAVALKCFKERS